MACGWRTTRGRAGRLVAALLLTAVPTSCSTRAGVLHAGALPPVNGERRAEGFFDEVQATRRSLPLSPLVRDPALDALARKGAQVIEAGLPESGRALDQVAAAAPLPDGLDYGVGFEPRTPGISPALRASGLRSAGDGMSNALLAADPALEAVGWASTGPWAVIVIRERRLGPADGPALHAAIEAGVQRERPALHLDPKLAAIADEVVADSLLDYDDQVRFGRAGGVPVRIWHRSTDLDLPTVSLDRALAEQGGGELREPWLGSVGVAAKVSESGTVLFVVLATGEADRRALSTDLSAATEQQTTEVVNRARAAVSLPEVRFDPWMVDGTKRWLADAAGRSCFPGIDTSCAGPDPMGGTRWWVQRGPWSQQEGGSGWDLTPTEPGDDQLTRFAAAATVGPDGLVWMVLLLAV